MREKRVLLCTWPKLIRYYLFACAIVVFPFGFALLFFGDERLIAPEYLQWGLPVFVISLLGMLGLWFETRRDAAALKISTAGLEVVSFLPPNGFLPRIGVFGPVPWADIRDVRLTQYGRFDVLVFEVADAWMNEDLLLPQTRLNAPAKAIEVSLEHARTAPSRILAIIKRARDAAP